MSKLLMSQIWTLLQLLHNKAYLKHSSTITLTAIVLLSKVFYVFTTTLQKQAPTILCHVFDANRTLLFYVFLEFFTYF